MQETQTTPLWAQEAWARVQADQARVDRLEELYLTDQRDKKDHPLHATYTGLHQAYEQQAG